MFEKSLYDLIRGLRNHKGNEREYIQNCLKECRTEIRSQDMDLKATALLKLIYLEMVGHDMSWASFHVLEVMSSPKYHQKRVGYLGAVQTFRPDTEVLMLATNLLKKDLTGAAMTTISLPIGALPHLVTPSLALSTLPDLLPRLSHTHPAIRKKTIVTLYRLALVYPEALRAAWPKVKERLMDNNEDPSVTSAIVNVICELGWRRPHDFLPLAPRMFELLVDGGNNWMAIKLIKLFATLTPLEPRLVRKLLPPLTDIIRTTPAMSLLYECINGIIQGGILGSEDDISGREEIASLCVTKLRGMMLIDGDPNLKYVALLAFNKIVVTHPFLVAQQEDVILECIDSADISIRVKALDLAQEMVSSDNLVSIISRLMRQLKPSSSPQNRSNGLARFEGTGDSEEEAEINVRENDQTLPLPRSYRIDVIGRILKMCSQNNYGNLTDFEWYIDILTQLVRTAPAPRQADHELDQLDTLGKASAADVSERIGAELRNVAVKVMAFRRAALAAAELIISQFAMESSSTRPVTSGALKPISWVVGEYVSQLSSPDNSLGYLLQLIPRSRQSEALTMCLQAAIKVFAFIAGDEQIIWRPERKSRISLLMARIIHILEPLTLHPDLEVQERAVEFTELLKLTVEAVSGQPASTNDVQQDPPLLLTQAIPSLFTGWEFHSVAHGAQKNVPLPDGLDLHEPIHPNLNGLLAEANSLAIPDDEEDEFENYYRQKPPAESISSSEPAVNRLAEAPEVVGSYQRAGKESYLDADILARKAERLERNRDDPFYIGGSSATQGTSTPIHDILRNENGPDVDLDLIPILQLDLDKLPSGHAANLAKPSQPSRPKPRQQFVVAADETLASSGHSTPRGYDSSENTSDGFTKTKSKKLNPKHPLLQVDSSHIGSFSLEGGSSDSPYDYEQQQREEAEMAKAVKEVERLRLEMQRANERIQVAQGVDAAGTVVKKKKKKVVKPRGEIEVENTEVVKVKKKKKTAGTAEAGGGNGTPGQPSDEAVAVTKPKKKNPKRIVDLHEPA